MSSSQSTELDRYYTDWRGVQVHVIRWDRVERQVIFTREG